MGVMDGEEEQADSVEQSAARAAWHARHPAGTLQQQRRQRVVCRLPMPASDKAGLRLSETCLRGDTFVERAKHREALLGLSCTTKGWQGGSPRATCTHPACIGLRRGCTFCCEHSCILSTATRHRSSVSPIPMAAAGCASSWKICSAASEAGSTVR